MALITANNLSMSFGAEDIFEGISVSIPQKARIALVGPNGSGKTTLLRLLMRMDVPTSGSVTHARNLIIGYLPQRADIALKGNDTVHDEMLKIFKPLVEKEAELARLSELLSSQPESQEILESYGETERQFELDGGYTFYDEIAQVLKGLGFQSRDHDRPVSQLSGGEKTRALLARLLLSKPTLLVLDEPTNHLDIQAIEWLENWLLDYEGALLLVSHDRFFMDKLVTDIWDLNFNQLHQYRGNYTHYVEQRDERYEYLRKNYKSQQEFVNKEVEYIRRNMAGQNTRQAQGRLKRLERFLSQGAITRPDEQKTITVQIDEVNRSGNQVIITKELEIGYQDDGIVLFRTPDIVLRRGECAALIGPNGAGKTTFIKTLLGEIPPLKGVARLGASVNVGYFAQAHEKLNDANTVLDEILSVKDMTATEARSFLGRYLFSGDDAFKPVSVLSGGERGRVALAKLSLSGANLLLLDEPTNHLDIPSQEILEAVLSDFAGTILLVSHDRYLIKNLATQIWSLEESFSRGISLSSLFIHEGTYMEYLDQLSQRKEEKWEERKNRKPRVENDSPAPQKRMNPHKLTRLITSIENEIDEIELALVNLSGELQAVSVEGDVAQVTRLGLEYKQKEERLAYLLEKWEEVLANQ